MADLVARSPLAAHHGGSDAATFHAGDISLIERPGLSAWLVTSHTPLALTDAIAIGPCEQLLVDTPCPALPPGSVLIQDMSSALTFIEITGPSVLEALGLPGMIRSASGGTATRLADLRVTIAWRDAPEPWLRIAVDRFSADYLWQWLARRITINMAA